MKSSRKALQDASESLFGDAPVEKTQARQKKSKKQEGHPSFELTKMFSSPPEDDAIDGHIASVFCRRYHFMWRRDGKFFIFQESKDGLVAGKYRGRALVYRVYRNYDDGAFVCPMSGHCDSILDYQELIYRDPKGIVLIGFNDVAAFYTQDNGFTPITDRKGLYV
jgi:hypothetical protein